MSDAFLVLAQRRRACRASSCRACCRRVSQRIPYRAAQDNSAPLNASSEIALDSAVRARRRRAGVRTIVEMVVHTRLDCVLGSGRHAAA